MSLRGEFCSHVTFADRRVGQARAGCQLRLVAGASGSRHREGVMSPFRSPGPGSRGRAARPRETGLTPRRASLAPSPRRPPTPPQRTVSVQLPGQLSVRENASRDSSEVCLVLAFPAGPLVWPLLSSRGAERSEAAPGHTDMGAQVERSTLHRFTCHHACCPEEATRQAVRDAARAGIPDGRQDMAALRASGPGVGRDGAVRPRACVWQQELRQHLRTALSTEGRTPRFTPFTGN